MALPEKCKYPKCDGTSFRQEGDNRFECKTCGLWQDGPKPSKSEKPDPKNDGKNQPS